MGLRFGMVFDDDPMGQAILAYEKANGGGTGTMRTDHETYVQLRNMQALLAYFVEKSKRQARRMLYALFPNVPSRSPGVEAGTKVFFHNDKVAGDVSVHIENGLDMDDVFWAAVLRARQSSPFRFLFLDYV